MMPVIMTGGGTTIDDQSSIEYSTDVNHDCSKSSVAFFPLISASVKQHTEYTK